MKRPMRFARFLGRFWPLWLVCAVIWAVPVSRGVAQHHLSGSIYDFYSDFSLRSFWRDIFGNRSNAVPNPLPAPGRHPRDIDLALWEAFWRSDGFYRRERDYNAESDLKGLIKKFPDQVIAYAPTVQNELEVYGWSNGVRQGQKNPNALSNTRLRDLARRARQLEPNNAFWPVAQAMSASRQGDQAETLKLLQIAARCPVYDDKTLEITRRILKAHERYGALRSYEKRAIAKPLRTGNGSSGATIQFWAKHAANLRRKGQHAQALQWSAALAGIGTLMQRDPNASTTIADGRNWQQFSWGMDGQGNKKLPASERFARYAMAQGRADIAVKARAQNKQSQATVEFLSSISDNSWNNWRGELWLQSDGLLGTLSLFDIVGFGLMLASCYLLFWWLVSNLLLWRAVGAPSPRAARVALSSIVVAVLLSLATAGMVWFVKYEQSLRPNKAHFEAYQNGFGSATVFGFLGAPFVLALAVAAITLWRGRERFDLSPRVDMELALPIWARALLRWFLPLGVIGTLLFFVGGWVLWITASWNDWSNVNLLALLPPDRNGVSIPWIWDLKSNPTPFIYGIFMCFVCLGVWFSKWRWASARDLRPLTHGALRWWKESLGCSIVVLFWAYFALALAVWPLQNRADARLDRVLNRGEIAVLRELQKSAKS